MKSKILLLLVFVVSAIATPTIPYIITHDGLIDQRAQDKINDIGLEVKSKLKANIYVDIRENNGIKTSLDRKERIALMKLKEAELTKNLQKPYAVLTISVDQMYANILMSNDLKDVIDRDDILDGYVIPLLASKDKNTLFAKSSAACLNGYAQMADSIANSQNIKLDSSIGSEGKTAGTIWRVFMYTLVVTGLVLYTVIILREKKYKKMANNEK